MGPFAMGVAADVMSGLALAALLYVARQMRAFRKEQRAFREEQRKVNEANALANRSLQRDVLFRYFHRIVECGEDVTPEEYEHLEKCADAYFMNGGNGVGKLMWDRIGEHVRLDTGRDD